MLWWMCWGVVGWSLEEHYRRPPEIPWDRPHTLPLLLALQWVALALLMPVGIAREVAMGLAISWMGLEALIGRFAF